jgi:RNA polymerase sigma factor (sigma-70 family)
VTSDRGGAVLRRIETLFGAGTCTGLSDGQLLDRFLAGRDEAAFAALVERHGAMVLRVCRAVLRDPDDAEDAFQATFLVLARRARSLRDDGSVGNWLFGVASRVASCARSAAARRRTHERKFAEMVSRPGVDPGSAGDDDRRVVHEEIGRLPVRFRAPVVLCYLEGWTCEEAAGRLGLPVGTVKSRLSRAKARLHSRLTRRGCAPGASASAPFPVMHAPAVPARLASSALKSAMAFTSGRLAPVGVLSASVATLTEGVLRTMFLSKLKLGALVALSAGAIAIGTGVLVGQEPATRKDGETSQATARGRQLDSALERSKRQFKRQLDSALEQAKRLARKEQDPPDQVKVQALKKQYLEAARHRLAAQKGFYEEGRITIDRYLDALRQWMSAEQLLSETADERAAVAKVYLQLCGEIEKREQSEVEVGRGTVADVSEASLARVVAELMASKVRDEQAESARLADVERRLGDLERKLDALIKADRLK